MAQKTKRTEGPHVARVPAPRLARQLAEAAAAETSAGAETALPAQRSRAGSRLPFEEDAAGSGCHELPHTTELQVHRHLLGQSDLAFSSLIVRRMNNGLCLQGVVETCDEEPDFARLVRQVAAVENVISQLVVRPRKG
ncbi:hypothetical protein GC176_12925 [bacterium]|nr:hypothetical protein [bacterium]